MLTLDERAAPGPVGRRTAPSKADRRLSSPRTLGEPARAGGKHAPASPTRRVVSVIGTALAIAAAPTAPALAQTGDWHGRVDSSLAKGEAGPDNVYSVSLPRNDLTVTRDGHQLRSALDLGSEVHFKPMGRGVMAMGELVLTDDEVAPVVTRLERHGIAVTALHKHILKTNPSVMWVHVRAQGDPAGIAAGLKDALSATGTRFPTQSAAASSATTLPVAELNRIMAAKGKETGGVLQFRIPTAQGITEDGLQLPAAMGPEIEVNMQAGGGDRSGATGEFPGAAARVNPLLTAMRRQGLEVVEVHNHMLGEEPRTFWVHFWGEDAPTRLAARLKAVVETVPTKR